jgi:hypothetical protein
MLRSFGRAANMLANAIAGFFIWIFKAILFLLTLVMMPWMFNMFWSWVDWSNPTSLPSIAGIAALIFMTVLTLSAIGELFDPFDIRSMRPKGGGGQMRSASHDDLREGGLFGGRQ